MSAMQPTYLHDYQPPAYRVTHTELKFDLSSSATRLTLGAEHAAGLVET